MDPFLDCDCSTRGCLVSEMNYLKMLEVTETDFSTKFFEMLQCFGTPRHVKNVPKCLLPKFIPCCHLHSVIEL